MEYISSTIKQKPGKKKTFDQLVNIFYVGSPVGCILSILFPSYTFPFFKWCTGIVNNRAAMFQIFRWYPSVLNMSSSQGFGHQATFYCNCHVVPPFLQLGSTPQCNENNVAMIIYCQEDTLNIPQFLTRYMGK